MSGKPVPSLVSFNLIYLSLVGEFRKTTRQIGDVIGIWETFQKLYGGETVRMEKVSGVTGVLNFEWHSAGGNSVEAIASDIANARDVITTLKRAWPQGSIQVNELIALFLGVKMPIEKEQDKLLKLVEEEEEVDLVQLQVDLGERLNMLKLSRSNGNSSSNANRAEARSSGSSNCNHRTRGGVQRVRAECWICTPRSCPSCRLLAATDPSIRFDHPHGYKGICKAETAGPPIGRAALASEDSWNKGVNLSPIVVEISANRATHEVNGRSSVWLIDSGCSSHMTLHHDLFQSYENVTRTIGTASKGVDIIATQMGNIRFLQNEVFGT